jgi:hypothetical protein
MIDEQRNSTATWFPAGASEGREGRASGERQARQAVTPHRHKQKQEAEAKAEAVAEAEERQQHIQLYQGILQCDSMGTTGREGGLVARASAYQIIPT